MIHGRKLTFCLLTSLALTFAVKARVNNTAANSGPYRAIVDRNVFDLRPIPPPPPTQAAPPPPPTNVKLVGLMIMKGHPEAAILSQEPPTPGAPPKPQVTTRMVPGQRKDSIELLEIDMAGKTAKVKVEENIMDLQLEVPKATMAAVPAQPGPALAPGPRAGMQGAKPGFTAAPAPPDSGVTPYMATYGGLPPRQLRTEEPEMTADQQAVLIEAQRDIYARQGNPIAQILPPTPFTSLLQQPDPANPSAPPVQTPVTQPGTPRGKFVPRTYTAPGMPGASQ